MAKKMGTREKRTLRVLLATGRSVAEKIGVVMYWPRINRASVRDAYYFDDPDKMKSLAGNKGTPAGTATLWRCQVCGSVMEDASLDGNAVHGHLIRFHGLKSREPGTVERLCLLKGRIAQWEGKDLTF